MIEVEQYCSKLNHPSSSVLLDINFLTSVVKLRYIPPQDKVKKRPKILEEGSQKSA